jgi:pimeloyl-ACP methyl ester carboxylesterase
MRDVVFLHSTGTGPAMWLRATRVLASLYPDAKAHALSNLGYPPGAAIDAPCTTALDDELAHLHAQLAPLEGRSFDLVAHSYGAFLGLKLLPELGGRVRSLYVWEPVLFGALSVHAERTKNPACTPLTDEPWLVDDATRGGTEPWLRLFVDYWNGQGSFDAMPAQARAQQLSLGWKMFQEVRTTSLDPAPFESYRVEVPFTLAVGALSPRASRTMSEEVRTQNPRARFVVHEGLGHMAPLTRPRAVLESVVEHLRTSG